MSEKVLQIRNLETFYGPVMAIRGVSLDVEEGKIVTVLGSNGAGKTTVLKTISGAMEPQKGSISFYGEDIAGMEPDRVASKGMGHVPEGREVFPFLSVQENLEMGAFRRRDKAEIEADPRAVDALWPQIGSFGKIVKEGNQKGNVCEITLLNWEDTGRFKVIMRTGHHTGQAKSYRPSEIIPCPLVDIPKKPEPGSKVSIIRICECLL